MGIKYSFASSRDLYLASMPRNLYGSKKDNGSLIIVGGSERFHGAPALASTAAYSVLAALRIGIGYATEFVPKSILEATRSVSPDLIVRSLKGKNLSLADLPLLRRKIDRSECFVIGPGIGRREDTCKAVIKLLDYAKSNDKRVVVDADAIYALSRYKRGLNKNFILTLNKTEFELFYKKKLDNEDLPSRIKAAVEVSNAIEANILLKGHDTIVTDGKRVKVIRAKSSALAVMGTGDTLSGIIGGYATKNSDLFIAGVAGAYLHTTIGDILHKEKGDHILASDVVGLIPRVLKKYDKD